MNPRGHMQPYLNNSLAIRQEIQRFESVHPSIYAIYDLIEAIPDSLIQQQIREHVVCIEDSFVNSQEWTLSRSVPDLKLGILGSVNSGKSALVHRYLTGSYMQEESPEGGRFKKEVVIDGQSYLLLIRDEGGTPEMQFTHWVDAIIFVFSLENEMSFNAIYSYYAKMAHYRNTSEVPLILVGTQDAISESKPRVIDDARARKLASDLKRCSYYETCATYGLNVERVFQDACQKVIAGKAATLTPNNSRPSTPNHSVMRGYYTAQGGVSGAATLGAAGKGYDSHSTSSQSTSGSGNLPTATPSNSSHNIQGHSPPFKDTLAKDKESKDHKHDKKHKDRYRSGDHPHAVPVPCPVPPIHHDLPPPPSHPPPPLEHTTPPPPPPQSQMALLQELREFQTPTSTPLATRRNKKNASIQKSNSFSGAAVLHRAANNQQNGGDLPTPTSTPILGRKNKAKSNISENSSETTTLTPNLGRKDGPRYRFSLIVEKVDSLAREFQLPANSPLTPILARIPRVRSSLVLTPWEDRMDSKDKPSDSKDLPTPSSTPTQTRKNRRRSTLFTQKKGDDDKLLGSGRAIPLKQGYLYKKSSKPLNKDWKKKYVTLCDDGKLTYHSSLHDYMDDAHGKEINLVRTTVKIPGGRPRGSMPTPQPKTNPNHNGEMNNLSGPGRNNGYDLDGAMVITNTTLTTGFFNNGTEFVLSGGSPNSKIETPNVKKRHRRAKSGTNKNLDGDGDSDGYEFMIVSLENKQWHFEAQSQDDREEWVIAIEQQILSSLQGQESTKQKSRSNTMTDPAAVQSIRAVKGNNICADCDSPNPDWASLNLGALICIECSGIHRNLGTHLSRVRSLDLDEWPPELVAVMTSIGNHLANSIWEANTKGRLKPSTSTAREEKEKYIRAKYDQKEFLPPPPYLDVPLSQQLIDAVARQDIHNAILVLGYAKNDHVNTPYSKSDTRTALHIASALGHTVLVQLLLWYGADVKMVDHEGRNALWYARSSGNLDCVDLLRVQGCPENPTLPRRRTSSQPNNNNEMLEKLPASVI